MTEGPRHPTQDTGVRGCHIWVDHTGAFKGQRCAGLLIEWRLSQDQRGRDEWQGLCVYLTSYSVGHGQSVQLRQSWIPAHMIRKA